MSSILGRAAFGAGAIVLALAFRRQLVALLTKTTGTWVGCPRAPASRPDS